MTELRYCTCFWACILGRTLMKKTMSRGRELSLEGQIYAKELEMLDGFSLGKKTAEKRDLRIQVPQWLSFRMWSRVIQNRSILWILFR